MSGISGLLEHVERTAVLDRVTAPVADWVRGRFRGTRAKDLAHGVPLGHPAHPALVLVPAGTLTAATLLDLVPGTERSRDALVTVGLLAAVPTAATGLADWSELRDEQQRVGVVHASLNLAALSCYALSLGASVTGRRGRARVLRGAGGVLLHAGGFVGAHLAHRQAVGANHAEQLPFQVELGWRTLCAVDDLPGEGRPARMLLDGNPLLVVREADVIHVLGEQCSHLAGPLSEGDVTVERGEMCVRCPWHGSTFALDDGRVVHGPATAPQPAFGVRVVNGRVQVRSPASPTETTSPETPETPADPDSR
jgi:nitrite reductase/ring-hydroxylating ferredoxin subunit